ncbi:5-methylcytosine restriction system specificity protein McrC, partial [Staphylococcus chromogenes]
FFQHSGDPRNIKPPNGRKRQRFKRDRTNGVSKQLKRGLQKEFKERNETIAVLRGKFNISYSIRSLIFLDKKLNCTYYALTENIYFNQILKTTLLVLVKLAITKGRQKRLKNYLYILIK